MPKFKAHLGFLPLLLLISCGSRPDPNTLVMIIESSPSNLDPRIGVDAQSERIDMLLFDSLVHRDEHFNLRPWLAESWEIPDPKTYIFHLRPGVLFHDGHPLSSRDVKWTIDSLLNGTVVSARAGAYKSITSVETPDGRTTIFHLKDADASLLWNLSDGAIGIVPFGSGPDFNQHPVGSGPFKFVRSEQDSEVVIERNDKYWALKPKIARVKFAIVPDTTTRALELRKGSADVALNAMTADMYLALRQDPKLILSSSPGTIYTYLAFNLRDPILKDVHVRQAIAYAIDRDEIIHYLWRGFARPAQSVLPPNHWAYTDQTAHYPHDPQRARALLDAAGFLMHNGTRFHLTMKTSTEENTRLMAAVLQQQLREVGIALDIRTFEFATFFADVTKGAFQLYSLRWIGGNEDPDIFEYAFHSASFPPKRANRSYYSNPRVDALIDRGRADLDQDHRRQIYGEVQQALSLDLPYVNLWYLDNVVVHSQRVKDVTLSPSGDYEFLITTRLQ